MFKLEPNPTFWATVSIPVPGQGSGTFDVEFRYLDKAARAVYFDALSEKSNLDALSEVISGWREIDASYSKENLSRLLDEYPTAPNALFDAFLKELTGVALKN